MDNQKEDAILMPTVRLLTKRMCDLFMLGEYCQYDHGRSYFYGVILEKDLDTISECTGEEWAALDGEMKIKYSMLGSGRMKSQQARNYRKWLLKNTKYSAIEHIEENMGKMIESMVEAVIYKKSNGAFKVLLDNFDIPGLREARGGASGKVEITARFLKENELTDISEKTTSQEARGDVLRSDVVPEYLDEAKQITSNNNVEGDSLQNTPA